MAAVRATKTIRPTGLMRHRERGTYKSKRWIVAHDRKRIPGEKNPVGDSSESEQIVNAAMSSQMQGLGTGNGVSGELLGLFAARRARKAKKKAVAAWEAQRRDQQR